MSTIDINEWSVLHLINMIKGAGRLWDWNGYIPPRIGVGDLNRGDQYRQHRQQFGCYWPPHDCHQNGTEADFRFVRNDGQELPLHIRKHAEDYDTIATADLMNSLFQNGDCVLIIVSDVCGIIFENIEVIYDTTGVHDDYFHLRIADPDGTGN